jgi:hypothetical protein
MTIALLFWDARGGMSSLRASWHSNVWQHSQSLRSTRWGRGGFAPDLQVIFRGQNLVRAPLIGSRPDLD